MKKKALFLSVAVVFTASLWGCGNGGGKSDNYSDYVTLGDYRSLTFEAKALKVDEGDYEELREEYLDEIAVREESTEPIAYGDEVTVSLYCSSDGEEIYDFLGDSAYTLVVGDKDFDKAFDDELVGMQVGDKKSFTLEHSEKSMDVALAGLTVDYDIEIVSSYKIVIPELTDELVKENFGAATVAEWEESVRNEAYEDAKADWKEDLKADVLNLVIENSTITGYPKSLYDEMKESVDAEYLEYAEMFGCSVEEIYDLFEVTKDDVKQEYLDAVNQEMVLALVIEKENITLSDTEFNEKLEDFAYEYGYDSGEEMLTEYDSEDLKSYFLSDKAEDFLVDLIVTNTEGL